MVGISRYDLYDAQRGLDLERLFEIPRFGSRYERYNLHKVLTKQIENHFAKKESSRNLIELYFSLGWLVLLLAFYSIGLAIMLFILYLMIGAILLSASGNSKIKVKLPPYPFLLDPREFGYFYYFDEHLKGTFEEIGQEMLLIRE